VDFGETSDDEDVDETFFFFFSLSHWRARRNGEEIAPRSFSLPFLLLLSLLSSARVLLSGDRKATNILILIVFCVKKNVRVVTCGVL